jgi:hypothetical protein
MRTPLKQAAAILVLALSTTACLPVSYIESGHSATGVSELRRPATPTPVFVKVQFYANGERQPDGDSMVKAEVVKDLIASKVLRPVASTRKAAILRIDVDNRYKVGQATGAGLLDGLTFGLAKAETRDDYHIAVDYRDPSGRRRMGSYTHAIVSASTIAKRPKNARPLDDVNDAFQVVIWQTVLDFLGDLQAVGNSGMSIMFVPHEQKDTSP